MELRKNLTKRDFVELHKEFGRSAAFGRILGMVESTGCKSVVIEKNPPEKEFLGEHKYFYKNVLSVAGESSPIRIHFFEGLIESVEDVSDKDGRYLGYCDLRPGNLRSISTALIDQRAFAVHVMRGFHILPEMSNSGSPPA